MSSLLGEARRVASVLATTEEPCKTHGVEADVYLITLTLEYFHPLFQTPFPYILMLVSTETSVYAVPPDGSAHPEQLLTGLEIRRVLMGEKRYIVAISDGAVNIKQEGGDKVIQSGITDRIDSLLVLKEDPLALLVGCTPPNLYKVL